MTVPCRLFVVSAVALVLPACLHLDAPAPFLPYPVPADSNTEPTSSSAGVATNRKPQFAELISRPGSVVPLMPATMEAVQTAPLPESVSVSIAPIAEPDKVPSPPPPEPPLLAAVRAYADNHPDRAIEHLAALGKPNQEFVLTILPALWQGATQNLTADPNGAAVLAEQLRTAAARIEPNAALRLDAVKFCRTVDGFGVYDPLPKGLPFKPNTLAQLYLEVRNMACRPAGPIGDLYVIQYLANIEIRDAYGKLVDQLNPNDYRRLTPVVQMKKERPTHTPVHEFHIVYGFNVPTTPGVYTISVKIEDLATRRTVKTEPIQFTVAGP